MRSFTVAYIMVWLILGSGIWIRGGAQTNPGPVEAAGLFRAGQFAEAEHVCTRLLAQEPANFQAALLLGRIVLLANRLDEAQKWLSRASQLKPEDKEPDRLLAEVFYRRDDFTKAAALLRALGKEAMAQQLESFQGLVPYQIKSETPAAHLPFIHTDPLPLVSVRVNSREEGYFLIDTGGSEVILDTEFASQVGAKRFGQEARTFGGGQSAPVEFGRIDSLTLGPIEVRHVPVHIMNTQPFSTAARGKPVRGILGTVLLYHFLATLDYPGGELILEPRTKYRPS